MPLYLLAVNEANSLTSIAEKLGRALVGRRICFGSAGGISNRSPSAHISRLHRHIDSSCDLP